MSFRYLDMEHYERIEHFRYFLSMPYPYAGVTVDADVTDIVSFCKARGYSFYLTFLHAAAKAADRMPELRRRIHDGVIIEYDTCPTSHTELCADGTYCYCTLRHDRIHRLCRDRAAAPPSGRLAARGRERGEHVFYLHAPVAALQRAHPARGGRRGIQPAYHLGRVCARRRGPPANAGDAARPPRARRRQSYGKVLRRAARRARRPHRGRALIHSIIYTPEAERRSLRLRLFSVESKKGLYKRAVFGYKSLQQD